MEMKEYKEMPNGVVLVTKTREHGGRSRFSEVPNEQVAREVPTESVARGSEVSKKSRVATRNFLSPKIKETVEGWKLATQTMHEYMCSLRATESVLYEECDGKCVMLCWVCGEAFEKGGDIKEHFGEEPNKIAGRYVAASDLEELSKSVRRVRACSSTVDVEVRKFLGETAGSGQKVIVGHKPVKNYVFAALVHVAGSGDVALAGWNARKVRAIADLCKHVWPEICEVSSERKDGLTVRLGL
jgi:hypothetical protein